jgi:hypothetical protein
MELYLNPPWHPRHITYRPARPPLNKVPALRVLYDFEFRLERGLSERELVSGDINGIRANLG